MFELKPMSGSTMRKILDARDLGRIGLATMASLSFRACVRGVQEFGDFKVQVVNDPAYGQLASEDLTNALDAINPAIVAELGGYCLNRAGSPSPKS